MNLTIYCTNHRCYIGPVHLVDVTSLNFEYVPIIDILKSDCTYKLRCKKISRNFKPEQLPVFKGYIELRKIGKCNINKYITKKIFKNNFELEYNVKQKAGMKWTIAQKDTRSIKTELSEQDLYHFIAFPKHTRESIHKSIWVFENGFVISHLVLALTRKKWIQKQIELRKEKLPRN